MADIKNNGNFSDDLKYQDSEKNNGTVNPKVNAENKFSSVSKGALKSIKIKKKKKVPLVVDIIIAVLLLAVVGGAVWSGYYIFRFFTVDYESADVTYIFAVPEASLEEDFKYSSLKNQYLYFDADGNTFGFGRIRKVEKNEADGMLLLTVEVNTKFRAEEGHSIDVYTVAVGKSYTLRTEQIRLDGTIVELFDKK